MKTKTQEGVRRYPPDGYVWDYDFEPDNRFYSRDEEYRPCTCKPTCTDPCKWSCDCIPCGKHYSDFLSFE